MRRKKAVGTTIRNFSRLFHSADRGGKRYPDRLEDLAAVSLAFAANTQPFTVLSNDDMFDKQPLESVTGRGLTMVKLLSQY
jgi:hypothetical protein